MKETWLAAVSGGPDSMALLQMCLERNIPCAAAHVNYHVRKEADEETETVRLFCASRNVVLHVLDQPFHFEGNFEAAARTYRYDFFVRLCREHGYAGILIAHHQDDHIETYFMQKEKNIVPSCYGLAAETMYHGVRVRRPLLEYTKQQLEQYCLAHHVPYHIDASNFDPSYTRNRVRMTVQQLSSLERTLVLREIIRDNAVMRERTCRVKTYVKDGSCRLEVYRRMIPDDRLALLRSLERDARMSLAQMKQIDDILMKKDDFVIPFHDRRLVQKEGRFFLHTAIAPYSYSFASAEEALAAGRFPAFAITKGEPGVNAVTLSPEDFPLTVRSVRDGDAVEMRFGRKKVSRFFIDRHIPRYLRPQWPVVENSAGVIILVPGLGCEKSHFSIMPQMNVVQYDLL